MFGRRKHDDFTERQRERQEQETRDQEDFVKYRKKTQAAIKKGLEAKKRFVIVDDEGYSSLWSIFAQAVTSVVNEQHEHVEDLDFHAVKDVHFDGFALLKLKVS